MADLATNVQSKKEEIKKVRAARDDIEQKIDEGEEEVLDLTTQLDDIGKEVEKKKALEATAADFTKVDEAN